MMILEGSSGFSNYFLHDVYILVQLNCVDGESVVDHTTATSQRGMFDSKIGEKGL